MIRVIIKKMMIIMMTTTTTMKIIRLAGSDRVEWGKMGHQGKMSQPLFFLKNLKKILAVMITKEGSYFLVFDENRKFVKSNILAE